MNQEQLTIGCIVNYLQLVKAYDELIISLEEELKYLKIISNELISMYEINDLSISKLLNIKETI